MMALVGLWEARYAHQALSAESLANYCDVYLHRDAVSQVALDQETQARQGYHTEILTAGVDSIVAVAFTTTSLHFARQWYALSFSGGA
jgi:hypothetical protein